MLGVHGAPLHLQLHVVELLASVILKSLVIVDLLAVRAGEVAVVEPLHAALVLHLLGHPLVLDVVLTVHGHVLVLLHGHR